MGHSPDFVPRLWKTRVSLKVTPFSSVPVLVIVIVLPSFEITRTLVAVILSVSPQNERLIDVLHRPSETYLCRVVRATGRQFRKEANQPAKS